MVPERQTSPNSCFDPIPSEMSNPELADYVSPPQVIPIQQVLPVQPSAESNDVRAHAKMPMQDGAREPYWKKEIYRTFFTVLTFIILYWLKRLFDKF